jgi:acyl carrier protein
MMEKEIISRVALAADVSPETVSLNTSLDAIGLDSLDIAELFLNIEKAHGVRIPDHKFSSAKTVRDIIDVLGQTN